MDEHFNKPQRQALAGIVIMAADSTLHLIRAIAIPFIIFLVKAEREFIAYFISGSLIIAALIILFSYLRYRRFTFFLDETKQEFVINKGLFNKTSLSISLDKIQQVNINQSFLQKIAGVYSLQIDTPGTEQKEVSIKAISGQAAYHLKDRLLNVTKDSLNSPLATNQQMPVLKLSNDTLFKVGLTSNYASSLALLVGFCFALFHNVKELFRAFDVDNGQVEAIVKSGLTLLSMGLFTVLLLGVLLVINLSRTFLKYFGFEIIGHQQALHITSGLFARKSTLLSPSKIQITTYSQNYFQKKLRFFNLNLKQAHAGHSENEKESSNDNLHIPGCGANERQELLALILGEIPPPGKIFIPDYRFLNLPIFFKVVLPIGIYGLFCLSFDALKPFYPLAIAYFIVSVLMIYRSYRIHRLEVSREFILKRSGIWDISNDIIRPHKIQAITTFQYPWHKKADVGHVNLHTAAGTIHFKYGNFTAIKSLTNYWLYEVESGSDEWM